MSEFNFKSQICTDKIQSERLLSLGLKKETADMHHYMWSEGYLDTQACPPRRDSPRYIPAWSLHRLIEICPSNMRGYMCKNIFDEKYAIDEQFDELIATIGYYIKEGYFPKEYLV